MINKAMAQYGRIDFLVTSAGDLQQNGILDMSLEEWDAIIRVNLRGPFLCCHQAAPIMVKQGAGSIVKRGLTGGTQHLGSGRSGLHQLQGRGDRCSPGT